MPRSASPTTKQTTLFSEQTKYFHQIISLIQKNYRIFATSVAQEYVSTKNPLLHAAVQNIHMAFSKRFDFDDVRTSQTHITCHKSKQRERPMRCILCVSGQPAAYHIITYIIVGLSRCSVYRQVGNAKAFTS